MAATGLLGLAARTTKPGGRASMRSPWDINTVCTPGDISGFSRSAVTCAWPYSRSEAGATRPPSAWVSACAP